MDTETVVAIAVPAVMTPVGVFLGWWLAGRSAREHREWEEQRAIRERQEVAAERLRDTVIEAQGIAPNGVMNPRDAGGPIGAAHGRLRMAWTRASLLRDEGIDRCYHALDMVLFMAGQESLRESNEINYYPISVAVIDLRRALDAYLRREEQLPEPEFPSARELIRIAHPEGRNLGLRGINDHLIEHNIGA